MTYKYILLTVGPSCSGKTTYAEKVTRESDGKVVNINRDDLRMMLYPVGYHNYKFTKAREDHVTTVAQSMAETALSSGRSVIISDTNLDPNRWDYWKALATKHDASFLVSHFSVEPSELLRRNTARERSIPESVILKQVEKFEKNFPSEVNYFIPKPYVPAGAGADNVYIFDVDGTIAHMNGKRGPFEWDKVGIDDPDEHVIALLQMLWDIGYHICIMSGRDESCRAETEQWLARMGVMYSMLYMRPAGNYDKDTLIKEKLFEEHIAGKFNVCGVFDDRNCVVDMWRKKGLKVFQVADGDF